MREIEPPPFLPESPEPAFFIPYIDDAENAEMRTFDDARRFVRNYSFPIDEGSVMPVWAWLLIVGGLVGMVGAALICVFVYECTTMTFRRWDPLP